MSIQIYNSLKKIKEELPPPIKDKPIKMYSCGVTVYDHCHIGHARSLYIFDVIRRYLEYRDYKVHFVRNITDIDDKIVNKAKELNMTSEEVTSEYIKSYQKDLKDLGIEQTDPEPRATANIDIIKDAIIKLIEKGYAYHVDGDVYYDVRKFKGYGKLSGQSIEHLMEAVRIEPYSKKKDPLDFALWKKSKEGEPSWSSPWGEGRPGWHIECSCMSMKHLKTETLDIHAGGRDLIFPHHENEIAQSEALTGKPFAKYWIHHGLLTINGQKMAKSAGNFITIQDAVKKYPVDELKMLFLASHYMSPIDFTEQKMEEAHKALERFDILFWKAYEILKGMDVKPQPADFIDKNVNSLIEAMDDDFNTAKALGCLFEFINDINKYINQESTDQHYANVIYMAVHTIEEFAKEIFGLFLKEKEVDLDKEDKQLLEQRSQARLDKDFKRSDDLRDQLKSKGIVVEDTKDGQTWRWA